jgi:hypothetical protein
MFAASGLPQPASRLIGRPGCEPERDRREKAGTSQAVMPASRAMRRLTQAPIQPTA